jgi:uncharacterized tellurite resistance protein B-like protein
MFVFGASERVRRCLVRAMRSVARADGAETAKELALLSAVAHALGEAELASAPPYEDAHAIARDVAAEGVGSTEREHIIQAMLLMALMDGDGTDAEATLIDATALALGVDEPRTKNLRQLASGQIASMRLSLMRRGYFRDELMRTAKEEGVAGLYRTFGPIVGLADDPERARRFNDLGKLPNGTLGRSYWEFIVQNGFGFPGEHKAVAERGLWHDMTHVLGGYPTTPDGESNVVAFIAGYRKDDPFFWLFTVALQFQVGLKISPFSPGLRDQLDPTQWVLHHARGALVNRDLSEGWDIWSDIERPLEELRASFNILPVEKVAQARATIAT